MAYKGTLPLLPCLLLIRLRCLTGKSHRIIFVWHRAEFRSPLIHFQREAHLKPSLLIPGKEEVIKALLGVSSDSRAISRGEVQEDDLYQKPHVWLYSSNPRNYCLPLG